MPPGDLQQFIELLLQHNLLTRISVPSDPVLEITAITDRICKQPDGGQALLFDQPCGSRHRLATNLFGSPRRIALALGVPSLEGLTERFATLLNQIHQPEAERLDQQIAGLPDFSRFTPHASDKPLWTAEVEHAGLSAFPFLHSWPDDGSAEGFPRYITLPQVFSALPDGSDVNCGMYRCQIRGERELAIRWSDASGAARHLEAWRSSGKAMPVAIALGGPPATTFSAMLPLPGELDEMTFAGFLQDQPVALSMCRTVPLRVPSTAEIVIEGLVEPDETVIEGPFGNHTGFYSPAGPAALLRVSSISCRPGAVVPATVVGPPPMEDCWMAKVWERLLLAILRRYIPAIIDIHFPLEWTFHHSAIISLDKPERGMVREIAGRLWQLPWFRSSRLTIFTDAACTPADAPDLAWRCINLAGSVDDLFRDGAGARLALDATGSLYDRIPVKPDPEIAARINQRWREYGL